MATSSAKSKSSLKSASTKSYNQKTLGAMKARDAAKGKSSSSAPKVITSGSRDAMLKNAMDIAKNIQSGIKESAASFTEAERASLSTGLSGAKTALDTYAASLPKSTAPSKPTEMTPLAPVATPTVTPPAGNITDATAGVAGMQAMIEQQRKDQLAREELRQQKQQDNAQSWLKDIISPKQAREDAWDETGIDQSKYFATQEKGIKEIESLTKEYNSVVEAKDTQIAATQDKMASMNFINNQTSQIERNAAPVLNRLSANINAKAATMEAQQGNFAQAQNYVNQAVQDATADAKFKVDMFSTFYKMNEDNFDRVDSIYSDAFKQSMAVAEAEYNRQYAEKSQIAEWLVKYPNSGITMTDSLMDAAKKAGVANLVTSKDGVSLTADMKNYEYAVRDGYTGSFADFIGKGGPGSNTNFVDIMQQAIDAGASPEEAAREAAMASENAGIPVDQATINSWTSQARSLTRTPPPPPALPGNNTVSSYDNVLGIYESLFR